MAIRLTLLLTLLVDSKCFSPQPVHPNDSLGCNKSFIPCRLQQTALFINFGWFSTKDDNQNQQKGDEGSGLSNEGRGNLGGVSGVMDSIERYKNAQRIGKMTASLIQDLSATTVEGVGAGGKVKVIFDCQQRVVRTILDVGFFESSSVSDVISALTEAMKDGFSKSKELSDQTTQNLYTELQSSGILELNLLDYSRQDVTNDASKAKIKIERLKASVKQDLSSNSVEGSAENGRVKAVYDCQQRPISVFMDESYFESAFLVEDVCDAVTAALQDAYTKSVERVDEKMKGLYLELGLPSN